MYLSTLQGMVLSDATHAGRAGLCQPIGELAHRSAFRFQIRDGFPAPRAAEESPWGHNITPMTKKESKEPKRTIRGPQVAGIWDYPRPQLRREQWVCLDGRWQFHIDEGGHLTSPANVTFDATIQVPFPETPASGVHDSRLYKAVWYRRTFAAPELADAASGCCCTSAPSTTRRRVWVNGRLAARHEGGYTPFSADVTDLLDGATAPQTIVVRAEDDPHDLAKPRGKQDWQLEPHSIWYPRTTGIWQTVWLETVAGHAASPSLRWTPNLERWEIGFEACARRPAPRATCGSACDLHVGGQLLADDTYSVVAGEVHRRIALSDPGIDDSRNELLWSPESPTLIEAELRALGRPRRAARSTRARATRPCARSRVQGDRFVLNGRPTCCGWCSTRATGRTSGLTAPDDDALRRDVELVKAMGFNGVRKHQKIEDPRFLYWADRLGLLVWEEMPSAYRFTHAAIERLTREWTEVIERDMQPSVHHRLGAVQRVVGRAGPARQSRRSGTTSQALYHLTKTLDPTRPVIGNDGWESVGDRHHRHPRLRRPSPIASPRATAADEVPAAACSSASDPAARLLVLGRSHARRASRSC